MPEPRSVPPIVDQVLRSSGHSLDPAVRADMERRFGHDFSKVRLHTDAKAQDSARAVNARAYTVGPDIVFGAGEHPGLSQRARPLLAHELAHVVQQAGASRLDASEPVEIADQPGDDRLEGEADAVAADVAAASDPDPRRSAGRLRASPLALSRDERDERPEPPEPAPRVAGDSVRASPPAGVAITNGTLHWELRYVGDPGETRPDLTITMGSDVRMTARFRPANGNRCPTITYLQTVRPTVGGVHDPAHTRLLETREPGSGRSADVLEREHEPYYGAGAAAGGQPGLTTEPEAALGGSATGRTQEATFSDKPVRATSAIPAGQTLERQFELAVICVETAQTFGSITWGYTKTRNGTITLTGGQPSDVRAGSASQELEATREAFYAGHFQHSLGGFGRGSASLTRAHRQTLDRVAATGGLRRLVLVGANDNSGGPEADPMLSRRRAEAARDYLVSRGVDAASIAVEGHGVAAREPNPPGRAVPANRRVDIRVERGLETGRRHASGSAMEASRLRRQNPRRTLWELGDWLGQWSIRRGPIPREECNQLTHILDGLQRWSGLDRSVPDVHEVYGETIRALRRRCAPEVPRVEFEYERPPLQPPSFVPRILRGVEDEPF